MAVGPIGNAIYVNQQTALVASEKNAVQNRFELQNLAAAASANEKEKEVAEVRPTEESHMIDPDREHTKEEAEQEMKRGEKEKKEEEKPPEEKPSERLLDIKV